MNEYKNPSSIALSSLENLRTRLLDLSGRNSLLNCKHGQKSNLRFIDELPDQLHGLLMSEEELGFLPVPEPTREELIEAGYIQIDKQTGTEVRLKKDPTAEEWACWLGLQTSYELPESKDSSVASKHDDKVIQTLLFPYELETRLRNLRSKAETSIEETGANILYFAFGFLEWFESSESDIPRLAPLLLIPVRLTKGKLNRRLGTYEYTIAYSDEDILPNLSLREKLRVDFALALPDINESTKPEEFFAEIKRLIEKNKPRWRVRRYATLALFNFSKLLMYMDLDENRWPENKSITAHPIIKSFFEKTETNARSKSHEYDIDELPKIHEQYPLIEDADSSQHSALVDALNGENLIIEGPPGTGKSQTITNLIAATIAKGEKVLFVAEKLAALEVVKRRLDATGLGDFCLELHSHKTQKRKIIEAISTRLHKRGSCRKPTRIKADIDRFESLKNQLREHAKQINGVWKNTDKSIHSILTAATRFRQQLNIDPITLHPVGLDGNSFTPEMQRLSRDKILSYGHVYPAVAECLSESSSLASHPWYGVNNSNLQFFDVDTVCKSLNLWQGTLRCLYSYCCEAFLLFGQNMPNGLDELQQLIKDFGSLPTLCGDERFDVLPILCGENLKECAFHLNNFREIQSLYANLSGNVAPHLLSDLSPIERLKVSGSELQQLGISKESGLKEIIRLLQRIDAVVLKLREILKILNEFKPRLSTAIQDRIGITEKGISDLRLFLDLAMALEPRFWNIRDEHFDNDELDNVLPELKVRVISLREQHLALSKTYKLKHLPSAPMLHEIQRHLSNGSILCWFKRDWRNARKQLFALSSEPEQRFKTLQLELDRLVKFAKEKENLNDDKRLHLLLGEHFRGLDTAVDDLLKIRSWYRLVRQSCGVVFGHRAEFGQALFDMPSDLARGVRSLAEQGLLKMTIDIIEELPQLKQIFPKIGTLNAEDDVPLLGEKGILLFLKEKLTRNIVPYQEYFVRDDITLNELETLITDLCRLRDLTEDWKTNNIDSKFFNGTLGLQIGACCDNKVQSEVAEHTVALASVIDNVVKSSILKEAIYGKPVKMQFDQLVAFGRKLAEIWINHRHSQNEFSILTSLDFSAWIRDSGDKIGKIIERNEKALKRADLLDKWLDYARIKPEVVELGFERIVKAIENGILSSVDIEAGYSLAVYDLLSREVLRETPDLSRFSGDVQEAIRKQFCEYDNKLKKLQQEHIAWRIDQNEIPDGVSGSRAAEHTELSLLKKECAKAKRHIPIRQLLKRAGKAVAALKPCFMMSPMSVAQYLEPGEVDFDLVVMDEASQIKPVEALGAVARGSQLVVVGDTKQLPPTSFFDRLSDDEDEEDPTVLQESESILEAVAFKSRRLRWHYRSKHESLINFSNQFFYDGELVLFPSPHHKSGEYGVKFTRVAKGRFVDRRNIEEVRVIAEAVKKHLLERPQESLGVVAMNVEQRDQIERAVETLAKEDVLFQVAMEQNLSGKEPIFIKNLENVQGDERDIIFISMTYGPQDIGAKVMQRFGPINSDTGWRRLNVLFTRSKKRMHIFSSMGSKDILLSPSSKLGVKALRDFLAYAETGILHKTQIPGRDPDSDFEIAVATALRSVGFECVPQVGVAGFYIDIAVCDIGNPGRFLMGIECDGANYHSAKSTRDRDRLRQTILERLGWNIRRIWSTDWYKNPKAQLQPIIQELNDLKTKNIVDSYVEPELEEVNRIANAVDRELKLDTPKSGNLQERLLQFDREVIRKDCPNTPENARLLRPAMLDALLEHKPISRSEFQEYIPAHLRLATGSEEGRYLNRVLEIINEASM